jgi:hypothetical protein
MKFTISRLLILVALAALNIRAGIETASHYPRPKATLFYVGEGRGIPSSAKPRVMRFDMPSLPQVWFPVIASGGFTLLVLLITFRGSIGRFGLPFRSRKSP